MYIATLQKLLLSVGLSSLVVNSRDDRSHPSQHWDIYHAEAAITAYIQRTITHIAFNQNVADFCLTINSKRNFGEIGNRQQYDPVAMTLSICRIT